MHQLLFQLLRVAIGTQTNLSRLPAEDEWVKLYRTAEKQSILGVCFAGLQNMGANADGGFARIGMSKSLYLTWMGMAVVIQKKNEMVNRQCVELQAKLTADGIRSCILKGQGVASLYSGHLLGLRQSGDIDIYVDCGRQRTLEYLRNLGMTDFEWDFVHAHPKFYKSTEVEMHYRVSVMRNLWTNYRLQKFFKQSEDELFISTVELPTGRIIVPSNWMNLFYLMQHAYRHLFTEGIGLRQVMDIYFTIKSSALSKADEERLKRATASFGLDRFASGMMWILQYVFDMDMMSMPWGLSQREGEFLLSEIMRSGNFGKDKRFGGKADSKVGKLLAVSRRTMHLIGHYSGEALSAPFYYVWHFLWKRIASSIDNYRDKYEY